MISGSSRRRTVKRPSRRLPAAARASAYFPSIRFSATSPFRHPDKAMSPCACSAKNRFEIRLDPPELGRIEVRLDVDRDGHVTSRLIADRSDTLNLLLKYEADVEKARREVRALSSGTPFAAS